MSVLHSVSSNVASRKPLTLKQKYLHMLSDLKAERKEKDNDDSWNYRLDKKIEELSQTIKEKNWSK